MANMEMMIATFWRCLYQSSKLHQNQNQLVRFMVDEGDANFNELLKALILKTQNQDVFWNRYLSWFMYNRKNLIKLYSRKAIYKRNPESLTNIVNLGQLAIEDGNEEAAKEFWALSAKHKI
jgi:hypothetical protein